MYKIKKIWITSQNYFIFSPYYFKEKKMTSKMFLATFLFLGVLIAIAALGLLIAFPVMWTWNATMPYLFSLPVLTWGKAWCLYFLSGCLIKSVTTNHVSK